MLHIVTIQLQMVKHQINTDTEYLVYGMERAKTSSKL
jgi:hypothetical protein